MIDDQIAYSRFKFFGRIKKDSSLWVKFPEYDQWQALTDKLVAEAPDGMKSMF